MFSVYRFSSLAILLRYSVLLVTFIVASNMLSMSSVSAVFFGSSFNKKIKANVLDYKCLEMIKENNIADIKRYLQNNPEALLSRDKYGKGYLHHAVYFASADVFNFILANAKFKNLDMQDNDGYTALHHAANQDKEAIVLALINAGAATNVKSFSDQTPLQLVFNKPNKRIALILLQLENFQSIWSRNTLVKACRSLSNNDIAGQSLCNNIFANIDSASQVIEQFIANQYAKNSVVTMYVPMPYGERLRYNNLTHDDPIYASQTNIVSVRRQKAFSQRHDETDPMANDVSIQNKYMLSSLNRDNKVSDISKGNVVQQNLVRDLGSYDDDYSFLMDHKTKVHRHMPTSKGTTFHKEMQSYRDYQTTYKSAVKAQDNYLSHIQDTINQEL